jgi:hypothetical protein
MKEHKTAIEAERQTAKQNLQREKDIIEERNLNKINERDEVISQMKGMCEELAEKF